MDEWDEKAAKLYDEWRGGTQIGDRFTRLVAAELRAASLKGLETNEAIFAWLLGENGSFPFRQEGEGAYYWRKELSRRIDEAKAQPK